MIDNQKYTITLNEKEANEYFLYSNQRLIKEILTNLEKPKLFIKQQTTICNNASFEDNLRLYSLLSFLRNSTDRVRRFIEESAEKRKKEIEDGSK